LEALGKEVADAKHSSAHSLWVYENVAEMATLETAIKTDWGELSELIVQKQKVRRAPFLLAVLPRCSSLTDPCGIIVYHTPCSDYSGPTMIWHVNGSPRTGAFVRTRTRSSGR
jgi:hypothetical protein